MPFNPGGVFSLVASYFATAGSTIRTEQHNPVLEDIASALSNVLIRDGRAPMTGPLNMNGFAVVGVNPGSTTDSVATVGQGVPIGAMMEFAGDTAPTGWMFCAGQAVSRTVYAALFERLGTKFGAGNGTTTFNLPDRRGRAAFGRDDMGGTAAGRLTQANFGADPKIVGSSGGGESTAMALANLIQHDHSVFLHDPGHTHTTNGVRPNGTGANNPGQVSPISFGQTIDSATTGITLWSDGDNSGTQNKVGKTGSATPTPMRTVPPGLICNTIIRVSYDG